MNYKLDNKPISDFGAVPLRGKGVLAVDGIFDLPKRIGQTEYDWGTHIEPFLTAEDIQLDGRTLSLNVAVKDEGNNVDLFVSACIACRVFSCDLDSFEVLCIDEIKVSKFGIYQTVDVRFRQSEFQLKPLSIAPSGNGRYKLDDFNLNKDFGIFISEAVDFKNIAKRIEVNTSETYLKTQYRGVNSIDVPCFLKGNSPMELYDKIMQFWALCMKPDKRQFTTPDFTKQIYVKDGARAEIISKNILKFSLKISYE